MRIRGHDLVYLRKLMTSFNDAIYFCFVPQVSEVGTAATIRQRE